MCSTTSRSTKLNVQKLCCLTITLGSRQLRDSQLRLSATFFSLITQFNHISASDQCCKAF
jgi:hypothetical protein